MANFEVIDAFRYFVGDRPTVTFNNTTADGVNASWVLTNKPVVIGSESVYIDGIIQQNGVQVATVSGAHTAGAYQVQLSTVSGVDVGDFLAFGASLDPEKFQVTAVNTTTNQVVLNRRVEDIIADSTVVYRMTRDYTIKYRDGIVFFPASPVLGKPLNCNYSYTQWDDALLSQLLDQAEQQATADNGDTMSLGDVSQRAVIFLLAKAKLVDVYVGAQAGSTIKVKQGSTSLDLSGSTRTLEKQRDELARQYVEALNRYQMGVLDASLGEAIVGSEDLQA